MCVCVYVWSHTRWARVRFCLACGAERPSLPCADLWLRGVPWLRLLCLLVEAVEQESDGSISIPLSVSYYWVFELLKQSVNRYLLKPYSFTVYRLRAFHYAIHSRAVYTPSPSLCAVHNDPTASSLPLALVHLRGMRNQRSRRGSVTPGARGRRRLTTAGQLGDMTA